MSGPRRRHVWTARIPPERLLAFIGGIEEEFVADSRGLPIHRLERDQLEAHRRKAARRARRASGLLGRLLSRGGRP